MNKHFYGLYKSCRDLVELYENIDEIDLSDPFHNFVMSTKANVERQDRIDEQYLIKYLEEKGQVNDQGQ